jgi:hypothetical protein
MTIPPLESPLPLPHGRVSSPPLLWPGGPSTLPGHGGLDCSFAGFGVGVGLGVGLGVGFGVACGVGVGLGVGFGVACGVGVGLGVGPTTGVAAGVGVGRTATITPGDVGVGDGSVVGETLGAGDGDGNADGPIGTDGCGDPLAVGPEGATGDAEGSSDPGRLEGPPAMTSPSLGAEMPTANANVARTRLRRPRATTSRAR